jgi:hypothetical protein
VIRRRISILVSSALIATMAATASAQTPNGTTLPKPPAATKPQATGKPLVAAPGAPTTRPSGLIQRDPFEVARTTDTALNCRGPLRLEVTQNDPRDGSKGVSMKVIFNEAVSATNVQPGQCWRTGGFRLAGITADGVSLSADQGKGEIVHAPDLKKCPLMKSFAIEGGKLKDPQVNDGTVAYSFVDAATSTGAVTLWTRWLDHKGGVPVGSTRTGYGRYAPVFGDGVTPGVPGCR